MNVFTRFSYVHDLFQQGQWQKKKTRGNVFYHANAQPAYLALIHFLCLRHTKSTSRKSWNNWLCWRQQMKTFQRNLETFEVYWQQENMRIQNEDLIHSKRICKKIDTSVNLEIFCLCNIWWKKWEEESFYTHQHKVDHLGLLLQRSRMILVMTDGCFSLRDAKHAKTSSQTQLFQSLRKFDTIGGPKKIKWSNHRLLLFWAE